MPTYILSDDIAQEARSVGVMAAGLKPKSPESQTSRTTEDSAFNKAGVPCSPTSGSVSSTPIELPESPVARVHSAHLKATSAEAKGEVQGSKRVEEAPKVSPLVAMTTILSFFLLKVFASTRELYRKVFPEKTGRGQKDGYAPLLKDFDYVWQRHYYRRVRDCWNRPIDSRPSRVIGVMDRVSHDGNATLPLTGTITPCVNLSSYNYLGFAENTPSITHRVLDSIDRFGVASCSAPQQAGQHGPVAQLERAFADFLNKDDCIVCGMGFGTNFQGLPALFGRDTLVISDTLNHSSLVNGVRISGAKVKVFEHGNYEQLENVLREAVVLGQKPTGEYVPWTRILIIVEGVYSMEGEIVDLPRVVALKKKYGALLFLDEAHSIGAIGQTGRGVTEHCKVDRKDVDILMGTFTKSFGAIGGYLAGEQSVIDYLRTHGSIALHCDTLAPPCAEQVLAVLDVLLGRDGTDLGRKRIHQLKENSRFFRQGLIERGFTVLGDDASPVVPVMIYHGAKMAVVSRECLRRGLAVVIVGYPATPLLGGRVRFCVSAAHTREDLQFALEVMDEVAREVYIQFEPRKKSLQ